MPSQVRESVSGLIDEAGRIERESETIYLELGRLFPLLSVEMERGVEKGKTSFAALEALGAFRRGGGPGHKDIGRPLRNGAPTKDTGATFVDDATRFFAYLRERDSSFLAKINEGISRLSALDEIISRVRADSEEMEIISLNAMTVALKSGAEGKAFSVITDELKRLSGRTIASAEGVTKNGRFLLDFFAKLRKALTELDDFQRDFFSLIDKTLGAGYDDIERGLAEATTFFSALLDEAQKGTRSRAAGHGRGPASGYRAAVPPTRGDFPGGGAGVGRRPIRSRLRRGRRRPFREPDRGRRRQAGRQRRVLRLRYEGSELDCRRERGQARRSTSRPRRRRGPASTREPSRGGPIATSSSSAK